jgi:hypothetical protein
MELEAKKLIYDLKQNTLPGLRQEIAEIKRDFVIE